MPVVGLTGSPGDAEHRGRSAVAQEVGEGVGKAAGRRVYDAFWVERVDLLGMRNEPGAGGRRAGDWLGADKVMRASPDRTFDTNH